MLNNVEFLQQRLQLDFEFNIVEYRVQSLLENYLKNHDSQSEHVRFYWVVFWVLLLLGETHHQLRGQEDALDIFG